MSSHYYVQATVFCNSRARYMRHRLSPKGGNNLTEGCQKKVLWSAYEGNSPENVEVLKGVCIKCFLEKMKLEMCLEEQIRFDRHMGEMRNFEKW